MFAMKKYIIIHLVYSSLLLLTPTNGNAEGQVSTQNTVPEDQVKAQTPEVKVQAAETKEQTPEDKTQKPVKTDDRFKIAYFGKYSQENFDKKVLPYFNQTNPGIKVVMINQIQQQIDQMPESNQLLDKLKSLESDYKIIYLDINFKYSDANKAIAEELEKRISGGQIVICSSGFPQKDEPTIALSKSLCGKTTNAIILGELTERERLLPTSYYGPELLTALKPSREYLGQGLAPMLFVSKLATKWKIRKPNEWIEYFNARKIKNKKLWADLGDFF